VLASLRAPGALKRVLDRRRAARATASGLRAREGHAGVARASSSHQQVAWASTLDVGTLGAEPCHSMDYGRQSNPACVK
jgi:hypothetical protein